MHLDLFFVCLFVLFCFLLLIERSLPIQGHRREKQSIFIVNTETDLRTFSAKSGVCFWEKMGGLFIQDRTENREIKWMFTYWQCGSNSTCSSPAVSKNRVRIYLHEESWKSPTWKIWLALKKDLHLLTLSVCQWVGLSRWLLRRTKLPDVIHAHRTSMNLWVQHF